MQENNFVLVNCDTDSITICDPIFKDFTKEEREELLNKLNALFPDKIRWEDDGYYHTVIVLKTKNYVLYDGNKLKIKGSALKDSKKEPAIQEMLLEIIKAMINKQNNYKEIYDKYIIEAMNVKDIRRWSSKKTITEKVLTSQRTNETKLKDALKNNEYMEGDKVWVYFKKDGSLELRDNFNGDYDKIRLLDKCYRSILIFQEILDIDKYFIKYHLKKNKNLLESLIGRNIDEEI
jgi:hypothetical protein